MHGCVVKSYLSLAFVATLWPLSILRPQPARLAVLLASHESVEGELLSVRDSSLVISTKPAYDKSEIPPPVSAITVIATREIEKVTIRADYHILDGMGKGFLIGAAGGAVVGLLSGDDPPGFLSLTAGDKALVLGITLGTGGVVIGAIIGAANSTGERELAPLPGGDLSMLKPVSKYPSFEPPWLQVIQ